MTCCTQTCSQGRYCPARLIQKDGGKTIDTSKECDLPSAALEDEPPVTAEHVFSAFEHWGSVGCIAVLILILAGSLAAAIHH